MLTRLADHIDDSTGEPVKIIRYGMWGTTDEIERHGRKWWIIHKEQKIAQCDTLAEAEVLLKDRLYI